MKLCLRLGAGLCLLFLWLAGCGGGGGPAVEAPPPAMPGMGQPTPLAAGKPAPTGTPGKPVAGGALNRYFPAAGSGMQRVFTQEKGGFAQADLTRGGKTVATLSISDTNANPSARSKFGSGSARVAGYPSAGVGANATAILVGNRYQVQVRSQDPTFDAGQREAWLQKFDLAGLAGL
ncbi:MAG: hypothetical protein FJX77_06500 [Armatimonadetes bacterium]|nr:hypothetical protein [Armatimonadota bacterium]